MQRSKSAESITRILDDLENEFDQRKVKGYKNKPFQYPNNYDTTIQLEIETDLDHNDGKQNNDLTRNENLPSRCDKESEDITKTKPDEQNQVRDENLDESKIIPQVPTDKNIKTLCHSNNANSEFLTTHFEVLYYNGLYPGFGKHEIVQSHFQFMAFAFLSTLLILEGLATVKRYVLDNVIHEDELHKYVSLVYKFNRLLIRITFVKIALSNKISDLLVALDGGTNCNQNKDKKVSWAVKLSGVISLIIAIANGLDFGLYMFEGWSRAELLTWQSYDVSRMVLQWSRSNGSIVFVDTVYNKYSQDITGLTFLLGCVGTLWTTVSFLQDDLVKNIMMFAALYLLTGSITFKKKLKSVFSLNLKIIDEMKVEYDATYQKCKRINKVFGLLFTLLDLDNLFFTAYVLLEFLWKGINPFDKFQYAFSVTKICGTYYILANLCYTADIFKYWLTTKVYEFADNEKITKRVALIISQLNTTKVGLGCGTFLVNEGFVYKMAGIVASMFMFFVEAAKNEKSKTV